MWAGGERGEERKEVDDDASADCTHHAAPSVRPPGVLVAFVFGLFEVRRQGATDPTKISSHSFGIVHLLIFFLMYN